MKRIMFGWFAIAACFGLATTAIAQYSNPSYANQETFRYSSNGYTQDQEPSPSDQAVPDAPKSVADAPVAVAPQPAPATNPASGCDSSCDSGTQTYSYASSSDTACGGCGGAGCGSCLGGRLGSRIGSLGAGGGNRNNWVFGLRGLVFDRDYEDDRRLATNGAGDCLFTTDADLNAHGGFETFLGVRRCNGTGWQFSYFGLFPDQADVTFYSPGLYTNLDGLTELDLAGSDVALTYDTSDHLRLYRNSEIQNIELNFLRNAGCTQSLFGRPMNIEWIGGLRWLKFEESMRFAAFNSTGTYPAQTFYDLDVENNLVGFQLGARTDHCLSDKWSWTLGTKFGVYNNDIYHRQSIRDDLGNLATVVSGVGVGQDYNYSASKDDVSFLGELDLGLNYQFSSCWRANFGYRAIGVAGIALVADQIPFAFNDPYEVTSIKSNGSLVLHGAYFGLERSF